MVKDRVGVSKKTTRQLPSEDHVYGYQQPLDDEGAGACKLINSDNIVYMFIVRTNRQYKSIEFLILLLCSDIQLGNCEPHWGQGLS